MRFWTIRFRAILLNIPDLDVNWLSWDVLTVQNLPENYSIFSDFKDHPENWERGWVSPYWHDHMWWDDVGWTSMAALFCCDNQSTVLEAWPIATTSVPSFLAWSFLAWLRYDLFGVDPASSKDPKMGSTNTSTPKKASCLLHAARPPLKRKQRPQKAIQRRNCW